MSQLASVFDPIAICDSGVGGLAVAKALQALLPQETLHCIADTQNLPYGDKTEAELRGFLRRIVDFCLSRRYKMLVLGCNTITAVAESFLPTYLQQLGNPMQVCNVVDPVVAHLRTYPEEVCVGLVGTRYTIRSGMYQNRLRTSRVKLVPVATPLLASMVERWLGGGQLDQRLLNDCLSQLPVRSLQLFVPACTHYLFLAKNIERFFLERANPHIQVLDVAWIAAKAVKAFLREHALASPGPKRTPDCFMTTQQTVAFKRTVLRLFGQDAVGLDRTWPLEANLLCPNASGHSSEGDVGWGVGGAPGIAEGAGKIC